MIEIVNIIGPIMYVEKEWISQILAITIDYMGPIVIKKNAYNSVIHKNYFTVDGSFIAWLVAPTICVYVMFIMET